MFPCSSRVTLHQPLPLSSCAAILRFNPNPVFSVISALFAQMCHAGSPASQAESTVSAHFPSATGGVWERTNVRSILRVRDARSLGVLARHPSLATRLPAVAGHFCKSDELTHMDSHSCIKTHGGRASSESWRKSLIFLHYWAHRAAMLPSTAIPSAF